MKSHVAPLAGKVIEILSANGDLVDPGQIVLTLESMKVHVKVEAEVAGRVLDLRVKLNDSVGRGEVLFDVLPGDSALENEHAASSTASRVKSSVNDPETALAQESIRLHSLADDAHREQAVKKRHDKGYLSARENLALYCQAESFREYGRLAVAAQASRYSKEQLRENTAADGVITGMGKVPLGLDSAASEGLKTTFIINDYSVLAGTQGYYHHAKIDRMLDVAEQQRTPVVMYTEGGGGRPGDTDVLHINSGLGCTTFSNWARLEGVVPRISVANGYNFAGNAALFGAADIRIGTRQSWIGMAGPAMISGGGLGDFKPKDIGPVDVQSTNGVLDLVADDETHAATLAKQILGYLTGWTASEIAAPQSDLDHFMPSNRKLTYSMVELLAGVFDQDSVLELREGYGGAIKTLFARLNGMAVGLLASDCSVNGGAIDVAAGHKSAEFLELCNTWNIPVAIFCDTPGFMVGPAHEELGAVRELAKLFGSGAALDVPSVGVVVRKCYGLGGQALLGGSTKMPDAVVAWPTGEFGAMGLEGAVQLGFKKELAACQSDEERETLFSDLLAEQYRRGAATEVATVLEIDAVIQPSQTRQWLLDCLF